MGYEIKLYYVRVYEKGDSPYYANEKAIVDLDKTGYSNALIELKNKAQKDKHYPLCRMYIGTDECVTKDKYDDDLYAIPVAEVKAAIDECMKTELGDYYLMKVAKATTDAWCEIDPNIRVIIYGY